MPIALDYDDDGNVVGGHYVDVLPERRLGFESPHTRRGMPFDFNPPKLQHRLTPTILTPTQPREQQLHTPESVMPPSRCLPLEAARMWRPAPIPDHQNNADIARRGSFHNVGFHRNVLTTVPPSHQAASRSPDPSSRLPHHNNSREREQDNSPAASRGHQHEQFSDFTRFGDSQGRSSPDSHSYPSPGLDTKMSETTEIVASGAVTARETSRPTRQTPSVEASERSLSPYSQLQVSPSLEKARGFIANFTEHFKNNVDAVDTFERLCLDFNRKVIEPQDFYASVYLILLRTDSLHLLPGFLAFLPPLWKETDLTWLNRAIETKHKEDSQSERRLSPASPEQTLPKKRVKKRPINGFTTNSSDSEVPHQVAKAVSRSLYVNPAALTKSSGSYLLRDDFESSDSIRDYDDVTAATPRRIVKLKVSKQILATAPKTPPRKRKYNRRKSKKPFVPSTPAPANDSADPEDLSSTSLTRKGRFRYGLYRASEVQHFGHYLTRRAVLSRASRPYVHLICGQGFAHPHDVKDHHSNAAGKKGGPGCVAKTHDRKKKRLEWDAHSSCKIGYPGLNYTKVKDGYIVLDQESADKIEQAIQAGLDFQNNQGDVTVDDDSAADDKDAEGEEDDERVDSGIDEDADGDVEMIDAQEEIVSAAVTEEVSAVATQSGLRKRSTKFSYGGM